MQKYTYICWIHTDAIIIKTPDDKVARTNDARKEDAGRLLYKIFYLSSLFVSFERVVQSLRVSWRPNITEIFCPEDMAVSVVSFSFSMVAQPSIESPLSGVLAFLTTSFRCPSPTILLVLNYTRLSVLTLNSTDRNSTRRPYITFKLPRADMDTPPRLLPISGTGMCHFRSLWNGLCDRHRAEITVIQFRGHSLPVRQSMRLEWDRFFLVPFHQPISAHAISSHNCHQNVSPPSGALP